MRAFSWAIALLLAIVASGCVSPGDKASRTLALNTASVVELAKQANERGLASALAGAYDDAEKAFREAVQTDPRYAAAHNNLGLVLLSKRKFYEAAVEFRAASRLRPDAIEPVMNLAKLFEQIGWRLEAAEAYEHATKMNHLSEEAELGLAALRTEGQAKTVPP